MTGGLYATTDVTSTNQKLPSYDQKCASGGHFFYDVTVIKPQPAKMSEAPKSRAQLEPPELGKWRIPDDKLITELRDKIYGLRYKSIADVESAFNDIDVRMAIRAVSSRLARILLIENHFHILKGRIERHELSLEQQNVVNHLHSCYMQHIGNMLFKHGEGLEIASIEETPALDEILHVAPPRIYQCKNTFYILGNNAKGAVQLTQVTDETFHLLCRELYGYHQSFVGSFIVQLGYLPRLVKSHMRRTQAHIPTKVSETCSKSFGQELAWSAHNSLHQLEALQLPAKELIANLIFRICRLESDPLEDLNSIENLRAAKIFEIEHYLEILQRRMHNNLLNPTEHAMLGYLQARYQAHIGNMLFKREGGLTIAMMKPPETNALPKSSDVSTPCIYEFEGLFSVLGNDVNGKRRLTLVTDKKSQQLYRELVTRIPTHVGRPVKLGYLPNFVREDMARTGAHISTEQTAICSKSLGVELARLAYQKLSEFFRGAYENPHLYKNYFPAKNLEKLKETFLNRCQRDSESYDNAIKAGDSLKELAFQLQGKPNPPTPRIHFSS